MFKLRMLIMILALLVAAPAFAGFGDCKIASDHRTYLCATNDAQATYVPVSRAWFKQHCYTWSNGGAACYINAVAAQPGEKVAKTPGLLHKIAMGTAYAAIGIAVIMVIAEGGGGAFVG